MILKRDLSIDILRVIGLLGVILAHVSPPNKILLLRTFDVPLLVIVSGISYNHSNIKESALNYFNHRLLRLIAPTWAFLIIYFIYFSGADFVTNGEMVSKKIILNSFLLLNYGGIGYVWIIRVFLLVAIAAPIIRFIGEKIKNVIIFYVIILFLFCLYFYSIDSFIIGSVQSENRPIDIMIFEYFFYIVPYSLLFAIGVRLSELSNRDLLLFIIVFLLIFLLFYTNSTDFSFSRIESFKYPPQAFWTIYGIIISVSLYCMFKKISYNPFRRLFFFISSSSIWIYLWHVFLLANWSYGISHIPNILNHFLIKFFIIILFALLITYFQKKVLNYYLNNYNLNSFFKKTIVVCFLN